MNAEHNIFDMGIEQAVLSTLLYGDAMDEHIQNLTEAHFFPARHKMLFRYIKEIFKSGETYDVIMVNERIKLNYNDSQLIPESYLQELAALAPRFFAMESHVKRLQQLLTWRSILDASDKIRALTSNTTQNTDIAISKAQSIVNAIDSSEEDLTLNEASHYSVLAISEFIERHEAWNKNEKLVKGVKTGFADLDEKLIELEDGDLIVIGARNSMGKTTFLQNLAQNISLLQRKPILFASAEMGGAQIMQRMISCMAKVPLRAIKTGEVRDLDDIGKISDAANIFEKLPIMINDKASMPLSEIRRSARKVVSKYGSIGAILVDYLQKLEPPEKRSREDLEIADISNELKKIAREFNCPVIALAQLNRAVEKDKDKRPKSSDLRGSGAIEQDADVIMMIYRDEYYDPNSKDKGIAEIIITKCRNGETGTVRLATDLARCRFVDLDASYYQQQDI